MTDTRRTLMVVHAHPDDESLGSGGTLQHYGRRGVRTVVVICTGGEAGEISDPALATPENLGEVRRREAEAAIAILGVDRLAWLGYRDSGMAGAPENDDPRCFFRAKLEDAVGRLVRLVREERPQVITSYDVNGIYGHPDHVMAHRVAQAAYWASGDPGRFPEAGPAWRVAKLYEQVNPRSNMVRMREVMRAAGVERRRDGETPEDEERRFQERLQRFAVPDDAVTTLIDIRPYVDKKREAVLAHRTQMGPDSRFARMPDELRRQLWTHERYRLVAGPCAPGPDGLEDDLFAGI
ncbi:MAG TPA: N-acetyl-1-D-myo-inositol-2-amino-2-deoxy-alpha-D-glucopyranoside deacetylase [Chloroflexota bacterium]|nr:N-acetyl-1-D-myo-inositol-2-amino-2-deoxy-alpha-D-glucopyranoside deacetylase [Chloroflexota bacterium]